MEKIATKEQISLLLTQLLTNDKEISDKIEEKIAEAISSEPFNVGKVNVSVFIFITWSNLSIVESPTALTEIPSIVKSPLKIERNIS